MSQVQRLQKLQSEFRSKLQLAARSKNMAQVHQILAGAIDTCLNELIRVEKSIDALTESLDSVSSSELDNEMGMNNDALF